MVSGCEPEMQSQYLAGHTLAGGGGVRRPGGSEDSGPLEQSGHSARDSESKWNTVMEICIRHKWPLIEAGMACHILPCEEIVF